MGYWGDDNTISLQSLIFPGQAAGRRLESRLLRKNTEAAKGIKTPVKDATVQLVLLLLLEEIMFQSNNTKVVSNKAEMQSAWKCFSCLSSVYKCIANFIHD